MKSIEESYLNALKRHRGGKQRFTQEEKDEIVEKKKVGWKIKIIAEFFNVSYSTIWLILNKSTNYAGTKSI